MPGRTHAVDTSLGEFEQLVLFAVLRLDEASGIAIHDEIEARTRRDVSPGAIYTTLGRLEERGARALRDAYAGLQALAGGSLGKLAQIAKGG